MARYTGNHCPVCEQPFADEDDIVVCPDCGTPYHRACWKRVGACMHQSEHAAGFEWQPEFGAEAEAAANAAICPNCGTHNKPGATRCSHCGVPLPGAQDTAQNAETPPQGDDPTPIYARDPHSVHSTQPRRDPQAPGPHLEGFSAGADGSIHRTEIGPEDPIDGIKARDWATFVGRSPMYYLMQFFRISETKRKATVSFSAFFFGSIYFFYRKMWQAGLLNAALELLLMVPSLLTILQQFNPGLLGSLPLGWLPAAGIVCELGMWALKIVRSLFAVYWYKQTAQTRIRDVYAQFPEGDGRTAALAASGGTNILYAVLFIGIWALLEIGFLYLAGPDFVQYLANWAQLYS